MPSKKMHVSTYLTPEEYAEVKANADRAGLSISKFLRLTSLGQPVKSLEYQKERMELRVLKGTIGQIGGLRNTLPAWTSTPTRRNSPLWRGVPVASAATTTGRA